MRLLFDENLSEALVRTLATEFPGSLHIRALGLGGADDSRVWTAAIEHGAVLVTRDEDYRHLSVHRGAPPKVVWIRVGNCSTATLGALLRLHSEELRVFERDAEAHFLALG